jgi:hypothetical protein
MSRQQLYRQSTIIAVHWIGSTLGRDVSYWPTPADLRVAQSGSASLGTSDVLLNVSARPFVTRSGPRLCILGPFVVQLHSGAAALVVAP